MLAAGQSRTGVVRLPLTLTSKAGLALPPRPGGGEVSAGLCRLPPPQVERVLHPLLQQQYELHRQRLEQRCDRRPAEHVLYHGTSAQAVADICTYGFNRSFCGRNGEALAGQGRGLCRPGRP